MSRKVNTILSPVLLRPELVRGHIVVVIDVLRATSTICTALAHGAHSVKAVSELEQALQLRKEGTILAGERGGVKVEGFDRGNSPLEFTQEVEGKEVVLTTTNGTAAVSAAVDAEVLCIGSFLNRSALCEFLDDRSEDISLLCAGWKGNVNLEDTLLAGAICHGLAGDQDFDDASLLAQSTFVMAAGDLEGHLKQSSHYERLMDLGVDEDISYCCQLDLLEGVPVLRDGLIVLNDTP